MFTSSSKVKRNKSLTRVTAPIVLAAFFVYGVSPSIVHSSELPPFEKGGIEGGFIKSTHSSSQASGEEQQKNFSFTPPTTINNQTEEVEDYDQFNNKIPKAIPVDSSQDSSQLTVQDFSLRHPTSLKLRGTSGYAGQAPDSKCQPTADSATNGGWGWDGEKGCKLGLESSFIERKVSPSFSRSLSRKARGGVGEKGGLRGDLQKSTPNPSFAKGGELRKSTPNPSYYKDM